MDKRLFLFFIGLILICLNFLSCNPHDDYALKFEIRNNSDSSVFFAFSYSYPDTNLNQINSVPYYNGNLWQKLLPHEGKNEGRGEFNLNPITLVFIFDANTIETVPWESIVKDNTVLKRYQLTKSDMEKNNWIITYP